MSHDICLLFHYTSEQTATPASTGPECHAEFD